MQELVFLPDEEDGDVLEHALQALGAEFGRVGFDTPAAASVLASAGVPRAEVHHDLAMSPETPEGPQGLRVIVTDTVPESGAARVLLETDQPVPQVSGGQFHAVCDYELAIPSKLHVGRRVVQRSGGPIGADFFHLVVVEAGGAPLAKAAVQLVAMTDEGALQYSGVTDHDGKVTIAHRASMLDGATVLVEPGFANHWGYLARDIDLVAGDTLKVRSIDLDNEGDALRLMMTRGTGSNGTGVTVAIIDTGVGPHVDLAGVIGDLDSSLGHGTHVAGIVAGIVAGKRRGAYLGIAPGASLRSYRVFDDPSTGLAKNFSIYKAIYAAVQQGCHLINLSLKIGQVGMEPVVSAVIKHASDNGVLCVAAAGNDFGKSVTFPARHPDCLAISACGHLDGLPTDAYDHWTVSSYRGASKKVFFGRFSNCGIDGTSVDYIAPGAGVVSTVPGDAYAPMSGTSMACPAAVGALARLLSAEPSVLSMPPDRMRHDRFKALAKQAAGSLGFDTEREGKGLIR